MPEDVIVAKNSKSKGQLKTLDSISNGDLILDIGEKTVKKISEIIDRSKTILWNGPAGYFEAKEFSSGSNKIAKKITKNTKNTDIHWGFFMTQDNWHVFHSQLCYVNLLKD